MIVFCSYFPANFSHANDNVQYNKFLELGNNIDGIPKQAWQNSQLKQGFTSVSNVSLIYGPNAKDDWSKGLESIANVSNLFSKFQQPKTTYVYLYGLSDVDWAEKKLADLLDESEEKSFRQNHSGQLAKVICRSTCYSAMQFTVNSPGQKAFNKKSIILIGTDVTLNQEYSTEKKTFSHEYFHSLMRIAQYEPIAQLDTYGEWPPLWFIEGTASFIENVSQNSKSYEKYLDYRKFHYNRNTNSLIWNKTFFDNFLNESILTTDWQNGNQDGMYEVGMRIVEILVAAEGIDSIMNVYLDIAKGNTFIQSFHNVYGIKWSEAKKVISKVLVEGNDQRLNVYDHIDNFIGGGGTQMKIFVAA